MDPRYSVFASRFVGPSGTRLLMDDLGEALAAGEDLCNLGGGNPARIPALQALFRARLRATLDDGTFDRVSGVYDGPQGNREFLRAVRDLLRREYGWPVEVDHIAVTAGSQSSFFILFNLFTGHCVDGRRRYLDLPLTPEYIGYADIAIEADALRARRPLIEHLDARQFKYRVDFPAFDLAADSGAVCVSRPTNPTGNVLDADEMSRLVEITASADVPLIVDNAYGVPFPGIVFDAVEPVWAEHVVYCLSLSKLGLPGLRTGIVVARPDIIEAIRSFNAILTLATGSLGAVLATDLVASGEVLRVVTEVVRPYYRQRVADAVSWCARHFDGIDYHVHKPEGAIFLWLWFPDLPITAQELYARLKARGVLVIPGHFFFPGLAGDWPHRHQCIRVSYAQDPVQVEHGIRVIGEEVRRAWQG
ncbi:MAG: valine--pyruvate transaminase [Gammaproteobacteria bacterium]|nr:valine--pyruvate transaminase [Gammaproteobacteria bacterium]